MERIKRHLIRSILAMAESEWYELIFQQINLSKARMFATLNTIDILLSDAMFWVFYWFLFHCRSTSESSIENND